jgi:WXXGXW repeat (2 copies)
MKRTNALRNLSLSLMLAASVFAAPAYAQVSFNISIAPPAPQYEVVPIIAPGYVWAPGYWGWTGERHVWVRGRSIVQREGYVWAPDRWEQRDRNYVRTAGHWEQDRGFKPVKVKHEKNHNGRDNDEHGDGHHDNGKHNGDKHER